MRRVMFFLSLLCWLATNVCVAETALSTAIRTRIEALSREPLGAIVVNDGTPGNGVPGNREPDGRTLGALVARFYALRSDQPLWQAPQRLLALNAALNGLADDGLSADAFGADRLVLDARWLQHAAPDADLARADIDVRATAAYLLALHQLRHGVLDVDAFYQDWKVAPPRANPADRLQVAVPEVDAQSADQDRARLQAETTVRLLSAAQDVVGDRIAAALAAARPAPPEYAALRAALRELRMQAVAGNGPPLLPPGQTLKPGMHDARVPLLRQRLLHADARPAPEPEPAAGAGAYAYDETLVQAVRSYQARHQLPVDGVVGAATLAMLNLPIAARIDQLRVNLERARWFLQDLPSRYVLIDIANYRLTYVDGERISERISWSSRVQVGRPDRPTPVLRSQVERLTLDPSWVVPPTILRNDVLPKLRRDPAYLARNHLRVFDAAGRALDASTIRWAQPPAGLIVRQDPGPSGALGVVAFRFSNTHQVYLHDTPHQALFERTPRAFSSGCVRVEHALELARLLLNEPMQWSEAALQTATEEGVTRSVILDHPVPLWMIYWTVRVHQDGSVSLLPDIYTQDSALRDNLARTLAAQQLAFSRP